MKYNDGKCDVHLMEKILLEKFEEKWLQLLPKVNEKLTITLNNSVLWKKRRESQLNMQLAHAKLARDLCNELYEVDTHVEELREMVVTRCSLQDSHCTGFEQTWYINFYNTHYFIFLTVREMTMKGNQVSCWSPGYAAIPPFFSAVAGSVNVLSDRELKLNEESLHDQLTIMPFAQYPQSSFLPFQYPGANNLGIPKAQLENHKILLQQQ